MPFLIMITITNQWSQSSELIKCDQSKLFFARLQIITLLLYNQKTARVSRKKNTMSNADDFYNRRK